MVTILLQAVLEMQAYQPCRPWTRPEKAEAGNAHLRLDHLAPIDWLQD
jgi:hypothetical protein